MHLRCDDLRQAAEEDRRRIADARARQAEAHASNLGLGHDLRAGLTSPTASSSTPCARSSATCSPALSEVIATGAGWTDAERPATGRRQRPTRAAPLDAIVDAELERAL